MEIAIQTYIATQSGVHGNGVTDDAPAIQKLLKSDRRVIFPKNRTYYLCSAVDTIYPASNPAALLVSRVRNLHVEASGATFKICPSISLSQTVLFERSTRWSWDGGIFVGSRSNLIQSQENVGFGLFNNVDFHVQRVRFEGYGGTGGAFVGDFNVNGIIRDVQMDGVGIGFDIAFNKNIFISNVRARGADTKGQSGPGQVGQKFFSNIFDVPLSPTLTLSSDAIYGSKTITYKIYPASTKLVIGMTYPIYGNGIPPGTTISPKTAHSGTDTGQLSNPTAFTLAKGTKLTAQFNFTDHNFSDTDGLTLINSDWSNFNTGIALASGKNFKFVNNDSHHNPGSGLSKSISYYIYYNADGIFSSVGHAVSDVSIQGGSSYNNGATVAGYGILVDSSKIKNSDTIKGINVNNLYMHEEINSCVGIIGTSFENINLSLEKSSKCRHSVSP